MTPGDRRYSPPYETDDETGVYEYPPPPPPSPPLEIGAEGGVYVDTDGPSPPLDSARRAGVNLGVVVRFEVVVERVERVERVDVERLLEGLRTVVAFICRIVVYS